MFLLFAPPAGASERVQILYAFKGGADGLTPSSSVVFDRDGNLYGTTLSGGGIGCGNFGCGTVYKLTPGGHESLIYSFKGGPADGVNPTNIIRDHDGNLYGTTYNGGLTGCPGGDCGTVFKIAPEGTESVLHFFAGGRDGANPAAGLLRDKKGNLYGTTKYGGNRLSDGTIFKIAPDGTETLLHVFHCTGSCSRGAVPASNLIADNAGNLYGTTPENVFQLATDGRLKVLHKFCAPNCLNGWDSEAGVVMDPAGNLYGTTYGGGDGNDCPATSGCGTVFEVTAGGRAKMLHEFEPSVDGVNPTTGVIIDKAGNFYGTIGQSKAPACKGKPGVVYRLAPDGSEKIYCIPSEIGGGVTERNGVLYGAGTGQGSFKHAAGFVFAVRP